MPTHMLPPRRNAIPPNISFSVISLRPASALRTRAAWACEYVMRGGGATARGVKNHDLLARLVVSWKQALHARHSRAEFRTYFYPPPPGARWNAPPRGPRAQQVPPPPPGSGGCYLRA